MELAIGLVGVAGSTTAILATLHRVLCHLHSQRRLSSKLAELIGAFEWTVNTTRMEIETLGSRLLRLQQLHQQHIDQSSDPSTANMTNESWQRLQEGARAAKPSDQVYATFMQLEACASRALSLLTEYKGSPVIKGTRKRAAFGERVQQLHEELKMTRDRVYTMLHAEVWVQTTKQQWSELMRDVKQAREMNSADLQREFERTRLDNERFLAKHMALALSEGTSDYRKRTDLLNSLITLENVLTQEFDTPAQISAALTALMAVQKALLEISESQEILVAKVNELKNQLEQDASAVESRLDLLLQHMEHAISLMNRQVWRSQKWQDKERMPAVVDWLESLVTPSNALRSKLALRLLGPSEVIVDQDELVVEFTLSDTPAYVYVVDVAANGERTKLFPFPGVPRHTITAPGTYRIPEDDQDRMMCSSDGKSAIVLIAATKPVPALEALDSWVPTRGVSMKSQGTTRRIHYEGRFLDRIEPRSSHRKNSSSSNRRASRSSGHRRRSSSRSSGKS